MQAAAPVRCQCYRPGKGAILGGCTQFAEGCFAANNEMLIQYRSLDFDRIYFRGLNTVTGDGIKMAVVAGAPTPSVTTACMLGPGVRGIPLTSEITIPGGMDPMQLWVNQDAERFVTEDVVLAYTRATNAITMQEDVFSMVDAAVLHKLEDEGSRYGAGAYVMAGAKLTDIFGQLDEAIEDGNENIFRADTVEELAEQMGLDPEKFAATVAEYNAACETGVDEKYEKDPAHLVALAEPPFYGFHLIANLMNTMGGIKTNIDCQVMSAEKQPIPGLYAAGMECDGYSGETYGVTLPGSDQGICIAIGRVAGARAAEYAMA